MRAPSATRAQADVVLQAPAPSRTRMLAGRRMLTRSMARAQLAGRTDGEKLLPAVDSSIAAAVAALRQAQARAGPVPSASHACLLSAERRRLRCPRTRCTAWRHLRQRQQPSGYACAQRGGAFEAVLMAPHCCSGSTPSSAETSACRCPSASQTHRCASCLACARASLL